MNKNIDLKKILKHCPRGTRLYSTTFGYVNFKMLIPSSEYPIIVYCKEEINEKSFTADGKFMKNYDAECTLFPSKDQREWSKCSAAWYKKEEEKSIKPKFKVGDRIRHKGADKGDVYEISKVYCDSYGIAGFTWMIYIEYQDQYELVPNKFDPKTLKPFDKVLVRDNHYQNWTCGFFSHIVIFDDACKYNVGEVLYKMCIPYNDETKHLVGTTEEAPEYYRYWED